ncbi:MAG: glutathione synthase [Myxococcota bacterium]
MRHVFIVDALSSLSVLQDTTIAFMAEAQARGHEVWTCGVDPLEVTPGGQPRVRAVPTHLTGATPWFECGPARSHALREFDVVWMRKDPPYDLDYLYATHILSLVRPPTLVVNDPRGLREVDEKLYTLRFPELCPESLVSRDVEALLAFREKLGGEMILKPIGGCGGEGVFHLSAQDRNAVAILEMATDRGRRFQIAQRYVPEIREGDKRIILVEGKPVGAVLRIPRLHETRANFHVGGEAARTEITPRDREICAALEPSLVSEGIVFAGIDVIGGWLTEINVTSPTGIREIEALDGIRLEGDVLDAVEARAARCRARGEH